MSKDLVYSDEIVGAAIAELKAHLPANWFAAGETSGECPLVLLEHGDLADYVADAETLTNNLPAILIRPLGIVPDHAHSGTGGREMTDQAFRLVHIRRDDQCYTAAGAAEPNMTRARERYSKLIGKALFADASRRLDSPMLTSSDTAGANVVSHVFDRWDLGGGGAEEVSAISGWRVNSGTQVWAIACDFTVKVRSG